MTPFDVVVLAGGAGRRLGGVDKAAVTVDGTPLLDHVLACCAEARKVVVVGPRRPATRPVTWTRENPPGTGPLAGIAAGLARLTEPVAPTVVVLATDLPYLTTEAVHRLVAERAGRDAVLFEDADGRRQPLCAAYDSVALRSAVDRLPSVAGTPVRAVLENLRLRTIPDDGVAHDCDSPEDLDRARADLEANRP